MRTPDEPQTFSSHLAALPILGPRAAATTTTVMREAEARLFGSVWKFVHARARVGFFVIWRLHEP